MTGRKPCTVCGVVMVRDSHISTRQWEARRFCSRKCQGRDSRDSHRIPLEQSYVVQPNGCWEWTRHITPAGYGRAWRRDKPANTPAHRYVWMELVGPIPDGMDLDHLCRNTKCVNPAHMEPVTPAENNRRAAAIRATCPQGHPYDKVRDGYRSCSECRRQTQRAYVARKKEAARVLAA